MYVINILKALMLRPVAHNILLTTLIHQLG